MYYSAIGLLAAVILLIENQDILFYLSDGFKKPAWKVYRQFLLTVLVYYLADIAWGILESNKLARLLFADTSVYFVAMAAGMALWTQYIVVYLDQKGTFERFCLWTGRILAALVVILTVVNVFDPVLFTVDEQCVYRALGFRYGVLIAQIVLLFLITSHAFWVYMHRHTTAEARRRCRTLGLFGLIMGSCLIAQLWFAYLPMYAIGYLLGTCLIRAFVIGDEKEEYRRELEEATRVTGLKQSLTSLLDNMPALSFSKDVRTGVYLACNQSFAEYAHKQSPAQVVGLTDFEIFDHETAAHFVEDDRKALAMSRPYVLFEDVLDAGGNPRQFQTTKLKFYDPNGRMCLLGMSMDVTEAERAKEAYQQALHTSALYEDIINALSGDYFNLYYVDMQTDDYVEYGYRTEAGHQGTESYGTDFFAASRANAQSLIYEEDRDRVVEVFDKDRLRKEIKKNGMFIIQYRLLINGEPTYVNLKATCINGDDRHLIIGINNIDAQTKDRAAAMRAKEERKTYLRLSALNGNLIVLYYVDVETEQYSEFSSSEMYGKLGISKQGSEFFQTTYVNSLRTIYPEDQELFHTLMTKENVLNTIERDGVFAIDYRLLIDGTPTYVRLKAAQLVEDGRTMLIVGVLDEDANIRREQEFAHDLIAAKRMASVDALTGVKNKHAYATWEQKINDKIEGGEQEPFAVVVCDINNLKEVNDQFGHKEGDVCIRQACKRICNVFAHSPVFRVGGDEFVVLLTGEDYARRQELLQSVNELPEDLASVRVGSTVSAGMVEYDEDQHAALSAVFEAADAAMYSRKQHVKRLLAAAC